MTEEANRIRLCKECDWYHTPNCPINVPASKGVLGEGICLPVRRLKACERSLDETVAERDMLQKELKKMREKFYKYQEKYTNCKFERDKYEAMIKGRRNPEDYLDPDKTSIEEVDAAIRAAGGDPETIGKRGEKLARSLLVGRLQKKEGLPPKVPEGPPIELIKEGDVKRKE